MTKKGHSNDDPYDLRGKVTTDFFGKRFSEALKIWKEKEEKTQKQFVNADVPCDQVSNENSITRYKHGLIPDGATLKKMIEKRFALLDPPITIEFFLPNSHSDLYNDGIEYVSSLETELRKYANKIGLDCYLIDFMNNSAEFTDLYPLWTPIKENSAALLDSEKAEAHYRLTAAESRAAETATDFRVGNRLISRIDLHVIKDLQDFIVRIIKLWYVARQQEMDEEIKKADIARLNKIQTAKEKNKGGFITNKDTVLTVGELGKIDPYYKKWTEGIDDNVSILDVATKEKES